MGRDRTKGIVEVAVRSEETYPSRAHDSDIRVGGTPASRFGCSPGGRIGGGSEPGAGQLRQGSLPLPGSTRGRRDSGARTPAWPPRWLRVSGPHAGSQRGAGMARREEILIRSAQKIDPSDEDWLQNRDKPVDLNPMSDTNGDGVPVLLEYALGLNPDSLLGNQGRLPRARIHPQSDTLQLRYYRSRDDLTYSVQRSSDLLSWDAADVIQEYATEGRNVTAAYPLNGNRLIFLKLVVE